MTVKLDYRWRLRELMASRGIFSTAALRPLLAQRGVMRSPSQVYRLVADKPERLNLRTLMALMDILDCQMSDLIEPVPCSSTHTGQTTFAHVRTRSRQAQAVRHDGNAVLPGRQHPDRPTRGARVRPGGG